MFCSHCGSAVSDDASFCYKCGSALQQPASAHQSYSYQQTYRQPNHPSVDADLPMNWYKFLINFALIAGAILNGISGILAISGAQYSMYDVDASIIYEKIEGLQGLDVFYGSLLLCLALFTFITRQALAKYAAIGPKLLLGVYVANTVVGLFYTVSASALFENVNIDYDGASSAISTIIIGIVMVIVNYRYFQKRAHLFDEDFR